MPQTISAADQVPYIDTYALLRTDGITSIVVRLLQADALCISRAKNIVGSRNAAWRLSAQEIKAGRGASLLFLIDHERLHWT